MVQDDVPEVLQRARQAVAYMVSKSPSGGKHAGTQRIVVKLISEAISDLAEAPPVILEFYMKQLAALMYFTSTGEWPDWCEKPEDFTA